MLSGARIGLVTCSKVPELTTDDRLFALELSRRRAELVAVSWDDAAVDWRGFDALVVRSTWDYHLRVTAFTAWLDRLESLGVSLWNPIPLVRENVHKSYLQRLASSGVPSVPTRLLPRGTAADLPALLSGEGWERAVIKPAVSASAHETFVARPGDAHRIRRRLAALLEDGDVLVQPYVEAIETEGEWSLLYFGGEYSHAVKKRPAPGDFRVQSELGGSVALETPPAAIVEEGRAILERLDPPCLYARVDGVEVDGRLLLMELELIEPALFLGAHPESERHPAGGACGAPAGRLADALERLAFSRPGRASARGASPH